MMKNENSIFMNSSLSSFGFIICLAISLLASCTNTVTDNQREEESQFSGKEGTVVLNNSGSNAYLVTDVKGEGASANMNENNTDIALTVGGRYTFENESGASNHPLDFRDIDGNKLVGQSNSDGIYSEDNGVNVVREGDAITFTLTEDLANEMADYICSFHPTMNGSISVVE